MTSKEKKKEDAIARIMKGLDCSRKEAEVIWKEDDKINHMKDSEVTADLTKEQKEVSKKMRGTGTRKAPTVYDFKTRERKSNPTKAGVIAELANFLSEKSEYAVEDLEITNKERMIAFRIGEERFEVTLTQKRKPKS